MLFWVKCLISLNGLVSSWSKSSSLVKYSTFWVPTQLRISRTSSKMLAICLFVALPSFMSIWDSTDCAYWQTCSEDLEMTWVLSKRSSSTFSWLRKAQSSSFSKKVATCHPWTIWVSTWPFSLKGLSHKSFPSDLCTFYVTVCATQEWKAMWWRSTVVPWKEFCSWMMFTMTRDVGMQSLLGIRF